MSKTISITLDDGTEISGKLQPAPLSYYKFTDEGYLVLYINVPRDFVKMLMEQKTLITKELHITE